MSFHLTRQGVDFDYRSDRITYRWPWARRGLSRFTSVLIPDFNEFSEYWLKRGQSLAKISSCEKVVGFSLNVVLADWTRRCYPGVPVLVLYDVNPNARINEFWSKLPQGTTRVLTSSEVVVLMCKGERQGLELMQAIPPDLASACLYLDGGILDSNLWEDVVL